MSRLQGVILDIDGTLLDSNDAHARAWQAAFAAQGISVSFERVRALIGMGGDQLVPRVSDVQPDTPPYGQLKQGWEANFKRELPQLSPQPGARELLEALLGRGLRVIYGTSADEALLGDMLERAGLQGLEVPFTTASEVEASKPQPDIVRAALGKLGLPPGAVLMVGDTPFDVESAGQAGVRTVFLQCGGDAVPGDAWKVFATPADFAAHLEEVVRDASGG